MYRQWLRVYMRTQMIKHNKDLLQLVDDTLACWRSCTSTDMGRNHRHASFRCRRAHNRGPRGHQAEAEVPFEDGAEHDR